MKSLCRLAALTAIIATIPTAASAASFIKYGDRTSFESASGPTRLETFDSITSDIDLSTAHDLGGFTLHNQRVGAYGSSKVDAAPFTSGGASPTGTTYVQSQAYNFSGNYSALVITFDEEIAAFGGNFSSGSGNQLEMLVDGELLLGGVANAGDFFGFTSDKAFSRIELRARAGSGYTYTLDNLTFSTAAVPEPASWAMMICGFGLVGSTMRRRRTQVAFS